MIKKKHRPIKGGVFKMIGDERISLDPPQTDRSSSDTRALLPWRDAEERWRVFCFCLIQGYETGIYGLLRVCRFAEFDG